MKSNYSLVLTSAAFLVFSAAAGTRLLHPVDVRVLDLAQRETSGVLDAVGMFTSVAGGLEVTAVATVALATGLFVDGQRLLARRLLVMFVVTGLVEVVIKTVLPQVPVPEEALRGPDPSLLEMSTPYPYPSGHVLRSVILLGTVYVLWPNRLGRAGILVLLVGSAASRVYLGTHWSSDVIGGALLGIVGLVWAFGQSKATA